MNNRRSEYFGLVPLIGIEGIDDSQFLIEQFRERFHNTRFFDKLDHSFMSPPPVLSSGVHVRSDGIFCDDSSRFFAGLQHRFFDIAQRHTLPYHIDTIFCPAGDFYFPWF